MGYETRDRPANRSIEAVAEAVEENPELIKGYLIVAVRIDGTMVIAHNTCCLPHIVDMVIGEMIGHPEIALPQTGASPEHEL